MFLQHDSTIAHSTFELAPWNLPSFAQPEHEKVDARQNRYLRAPVAGINMFIILEEGLALPHVHVV